MVRSGPKISVIRIFGPIFLLWSELSVQAKNIFFWKKRIETLLKDQTTEFWTEILGPGMDRFISDHGLDQICTEISYAVLIRTSTDFK